jgi:hypothetical protein
MTAVGVAIRREFPNVILGVQVLAGANEEALAVAQGEYHILHLQRMTR